MNIESDDCIKKVISYGLEKIEKFDYETAKGVTGTIGNDDNEEARAQEFDFGDGCLMGVFGASENDVIIRMGYYYTSEIDES